MCGLSQNCQGPSRRVVASSPALGHTLRVVAGVGAFLVISIFAGLACTPQIERPHILLITADALRADHLSLNGYPRTTSPALDEFAGDAINFEQAISVIPKTGPSFATLFTGQHPNRHGVRHNNPGVPDEMPMLAEHFKALGYRTVAFTSNPVLRASKGYARGFDLYRELPSDRGVDEVNRTYLEWSKDAWSEATFVWIHYIDPHGPYDPPAELEVEFMLDDLSQSDVRVPLDKRVEVSRGGNKILGAIPKYQQRDQEDRLAAYIARYDAEIRHVDRAFGEIIDDLKSRNLYNESAIVFTSDHGESLGEHNFYFEHGWFAFDASLRVPLLIKWPGQLDGYVRSHSVSQLDLLPTLLAIAGERSPPKDAVGIDLHREPGDRPPIAVESALNYPERFVGLRSPEFKYLIRDRDGREEFYDLSADPSETRNLAGGENGNEIDQPVRNREALDEFRRRAKEVQRAGGFQSPSPSPPEAIDEGYRRALESLGYIDLE
jgi:arylsulfatase A-like enzyme